jgi:ATP-binding cassette, subfamily B, bacterial
MGTRGTVRSVARVVWSTARGQAIWLLCLSTISAVVLPISVWLSERVVNLAATAAEHRPVPSTWASWAIALGLVFAAQRAFQLSISNNQNRFAENVGVRIQQMFLEATSRADLESLESPEWRDRMTQAAHSVGGRPATLVLGFYQLYGAVIASLGYLVVLFTLSPLLVPLAVLMLVVNAPQQHIRAVSLYKLHSDFIKNQRERMYLQSLLSEIRPAREIRAYGLEPYLLDRHDRVASAWLSGFDAVMRRTGRHGWYVAVITAAVAAAAYVFTIHQGVRGAISPGGVTAVIAAFGGLASQLSAVTGGVSTVQESAKFLDDFFAFLSLKPRIVAPEQPKSLQADVGAAIEFEEVNFSYRGTGRPAIADLDLQVKGGELLAIVGENGSGKTTLVKLLLRFYDPDQGKILLGGVDIRDTNPGEFREQFGVLFQDFITFDFTVRENIALGRMSKKASDEEVVAALKDGQAWETVSRMRGGIDSHLGYIRDEGHNVSGGEMQRLALSRLFFRDANVWILDEPTSSLDPDAEAMVFGKFKALLGGRTGIIISHRFSTVRMADRIAVMAEGTVTELGTHEELISLGGRYAELFEAQAGPYH